MYLYDARDHHHCRDANDPEALREAYECNIYRYFFLSLRYFQPGSIIKSSPTPATPATSATPETPTTPATPLTPATPTTPATPATPTTPATFHISNVEASSWFVQRLVNNVLLSHYDFDNPFIKTAFEDDVLDEDAFFLADAMTAVFRLRNIAGDPR